MRLEPCLENIVWLESLVQLEIAASSTASNTFKSDFSENP